MRPAGQIDIFERDYFLDLHGASWPTATLQLFSGVSSKAAQPGSWETEGWSLEPAEVPRYLWRKISRTVEGGEKSLEEMALRFPSCPLFGIQRERQYQFKLRPINYHTLRILRPASCPEGWRAERIFLIFNGLNETDRLDFYYDLAGFLLSDRNTACIICPLPGHLMRYPMVGRFAEKPLHRFIGDPSDLFRQYLRAMMEAQWLLSILVPIGHYPVVPGTVLLGSSTDPKSGRCNPENLSEDIFTAWRLTRESSAQLLEPEDSEPAPRGDDVQQADILLTILALRDLVGWESLTKPLPSYPASEKLPPPRLHVIGYSLGGYLAQSVFFTWPFAVGSCSTICSGGALQEIRPIKFAHEEEWRAVTNGLKYELESGMLQQRLRMDQLAGAAGEGRSVCGIPIASFSSFFRIFNDVFLQDPNGSYRSRVSEFTHRLLFIVGGNDPIVTTSSVISASPREGINMIEIANLSHFVAMEQGEWGHFWLPTVSKLLLSFAERTELLLSRAVLQNLWRPDVDGPLEEDSWPRDDQTNKRIHHRESTPLASERFQQELMSIVDLLSDRHGFLLILRNRIPTALLGDTLLKRRGTIPHFEDRRIREYWQGLKERRDKMLACSDRLALVLPKRLRDWFVTPGAILSAKSEPSSRSVPDAASLRRIWEGFLETWETKDGALRCFDPQDLQLCAGDPASADIESLIRKDSQTPDDHPILNTLPDIWIFMSGEVVKGIAGDDQIKRDDVIAAFRKRVKDVYQQSPRNQNIKPDFTQTSEWLDSGKLRIIRISSASSNPRFLGERIWNLYGAMDLLIHSALALSCSSPCSNRGDFGR